MKALMIKSGNAFICSDEEALESMKAFKSGETYSVEVTRPRNLAFHRKWFALAKIAFDYWADSVAKREYKGVEVQPNFERFRKDLIIMAGYYEPYFNAKNEIRLDAKSISFAKMDAEEFEELYSKTIATILQNILPKDRYSEQSLRETVERIVRF